MRWDTNAVTSTAHLLGESGRPICGVREIILAGVDEGGVACSRCVRIAGDSAPVRLRDLPQDELLQCAALDPWGHAEGVELRRRRLGGDRPC